MKKIVQILPFIILMIVCVCSKPKKSDSINTKDEKTVTIIGVFELFPNPCLQDPCLPGMVCGIKSEDKKFIFTINNKWHWNEEFTWEDFSPALGDSVVVKGYLTTKKDIKDRSYTEIEIKELSPKLLDSKLNSRLEQP